jgi:peptide/nickel transport system substrate-binding protein
MLLKRSMLVVGLLVVMSMILSACAPAATPVATEAPTAAATATSVPARHGGWLDEIVFSVVTADSAITQLSAGAIDVYAGGLSSAQLPDIKKANLSYGASNGLYYDILYNPAVFKDTKVLNPFSDRKIREATNWLYDRNYINQEIYAGGGLPKFFPFQTNGPDYADLADTARSLEAKYAYNPDKAKQVISDEMTAMKATLGADGKWQFNGKPVVLNFLIRPDSDGTRKPLGDYVGKQLESVGFTVNYEYKKSFEASPIWAKSDPAAGQWNLYTAAWSSTAISRDEKGQFQQMYLNTSVQGLPVFLANVADPAFQKVGDDLANANFKSLDERRSMMEQAMALGLQDSLQVWLIDGKNYAPYSSKVQVTSDLAAGIEASQVGHYTARFIGQEGGQLKWGEPDLFAEPWNPIAGSNWTFDHAAYDATASQGFMADPFTGLQWPLRAEKADVTVQTGLTVGKTLDWVTLNTADSIPVPADAWADWDAKTQTFIPAGDGKTAKIKSVVYYPADLYKTVKWHDGSPFSAADVVMGIIETFDRAKKDSPIYDESYDQGYYQSWISSFKGVKIVSTDPLVIETYTDAYQPDAELDVTSWWPYYGYGEAGWDMIALGNAADGDGKLAWSTNKSTAKSVEETSFIGGPSLDVLSSELTTAASTTLIPYAPTMSKYVTADEAKARYANLQAWYKAHGHFWVGTGPYFLDKVFLTEKSLVLKNNPDYADAADRWSSFGEPKLADVVVDGPAQVKIGDQAVFDINITFKGDPYANKDIKQVKFLVYDATGAVVSTGVATAVEDGHFQATLGADITSKLTAGSDKIEVAVIPLPVSVPTFASFQFVTAP